MWTWRKSRSLLSPNPLRCRAIHAGCVTLLALALPALASQPPEALPLVKKDDPARVAGEWDYRTRSNCGTVEGVGKVSFTWNAAAGAYEERGFVYWADSGLTVHWWGRTRYDAARRRLDGRMRNSLGDSVDGGWQLEGPGPERLVVRWVQTNGCHGQGVARRIRPYPS
jgi:hypothetical protein